MVMGMVPGLVIFAISVGNGVFVPKVNKTNLSGIAQNVPKLVLGPLGLQTRRPPTEPRNGKSGKYPWWALRIFLYFVLLRGGEGGVRGARTGEGIVVN